MKAILKAALAAAVSGAFVGYLLKKRLYQASLGGPDQALARSQDPGIRSFAQRMMRDHGKSNSELARLAAAQSIAAPTKLDGRHQATLDKVTSKTGVDFDRSYSQHVYMGHIRGVALYEAAVKSPNAAISAFAHKMLPTLRDHKQLEEELSGGALEGAVPGGR